MITRIRFFSIIVSASSLLGVTAHATPKPGDLDIVPIHEKTGVEVECQRAVSGALWEDVKKQINAFCKNTPQTPMQLVLDFRPPRKDVCEKPGLSRWELVAKNRTTAPTPRLMILSCGGINGDQEKKLMQEFVRREALNRKEWLQFCEQCKPNQLIK